MRASVTGLGKSIPFAWSGRWALASVRDRRDGRRLMGCIEEPAGQSTEAWLIHFPHGGLTGSIVPAKGLRSGRAWCRGPPGTDRYSLLACHGLDRRIERLSVGEHTMQDH